MIKSKFFIFLLVLLFLASGCTETQKENSVFESRSFNLEILDLPNPNLELEEQELVVREVSYVNRTGAILEDEVWSGEIYVTGDLHVPEGVTLTIKPGTVILVSANSDDSGVGGEHIIDELTVEDPSSSEEYTLSHTHISIAGRLVAVGTPEQKIIFTSSAEEPSYTDWDGITFESTSSGEMKYSVIEWTHTGPALHGTDNVSISYSEIRHIFWGALHAFECSPVFEYNVLDDIGHEAFDTHKASPVIRYNNISHARTAIVFNYYDLRSEKPIIFENNIIENNGHLAVLQENAYVIIRNNTFIGSDDTGGPWHYKGFTLNVPDKSQGMNLADNVNVEIYDNKFINIDGPAIKYERVGPNQGIGHTTNIPEPFEIGDNPVKILVRNNYFSNMDDRKYLGQLRNKWENIEVLYNRYG